MCNNPITQILITQHNNLTASTEGKMWGIIKEVLALADETNKCSC